MKLFKDLSVESYWFYKQTKTVDESLSKDDNNNNDDNHVDDKNQDQTFSLKTMNMHEMFRIFIPATVQFLFF